MSEKNEHESVADHAKDRIRVLGVLSISVVIDVVFMAIWVLVNWLLDQKVLEPMRLSGADALLLTIFRYLFGGATLIAVLVYTVEDIIIMVVQALQRIKSRIRSGDKDETSH